MAQDTKGAGRRACAARRTRLALCSLLAGLSAAAPAPAQAATAASVVPRVSGLPWGSGVNGSSSENSAFTAWRGNRKLDVRTVFFGMRDWTHMSSSSGALSSLVNGGSGRLVTAIGMLPQTHRGQLAQCASGQFDPQIRAVTTGMLNNGAQGAANIGKPVIVRLGWEANNEGSFPWAATGNGASWKACFQRWVDILNPVSNGTRQKRFLVVWNMANRGTITYPVDQLWPGGDYVDIVGSQYYDMCPPLPDGDKYAFEARMDARTHSNNPAGPRAWLDYAKAKGKPYAMPEWGIGGARDMCTQPGVDNPYFIEKIYEFFWKNAADIAFEAYFNATGGEDPELGSHELFAPDMSGTQVQGSAAYTTYAQRYNPKAATKYRQLWGAGLEPPPPPPPPPPPEPPPPAPASDTLYWLRYVASYDDLITSIGPSASGGYASYLASGKAQKRTAYFDPQAYLDRYPAYKEQFGTDLIGATKHFITQGYPKGQFTYSSGPFYYLRYVASHPGLIPSLGTQATKAEAHFHHTGKFEGRTVTFDALAYLKSNAEAKALCGSSDQMCGVKHFINTH